MSGSKHIDELGSGYESKTVKEYDPAKTEGQMGKEHEEAVAPKNNWEDDKRDAIGHAASKRKKLARKLRRLAREIEAMGLEDDYEEAIEEVQDMVKEEVKEEKQDEPEDLSDEMEEEKQECKKASDEELIVEATHPIEHDPMQDNPEANMSSQTGDDEWIDIGPGEFDDPRDAVGRAQ